ncbi:hypothetical protein EDD11_010444 [Mortierella claussenii]|nr:hypothetical protein EDD11_010444 [Mortierella claussenii]
MRADHDSDCEEAAMSTVADKVMVNDSAILKHCTMTCQVSTPSSAAASLTSNANGGHSASHIQVTEKKAFPTQVSREDTPPLSSSSVASSPSSPSVCSPVSSLQEPLTFTTPSFPTALGGGVNTLNEPQASSLSRTNMEQNSSYMYNRSGSRSFSSASSIGSTPSYSALTIPMSSLIQSNECVYAAVPVSHELYIIPKSSRGFHWNGDLFLKPHQRRSLGVDQMFSMADQQQYSEIGDSGGGDIHVNGQQHNQHRHNQDSSVIVHEIWLDDQETAGILPTWP